MDIFKLDPKDWEKYKKIRLEALQENPEAFGSSYEKEIAFPDETWQERCGNENVCIIN